MSNFKDFTKITAVVASIWAITSLAFLATDAVFNMAYGKPPAHSNAGGNGGGNSPSSGNNPGQGNGNGVSTGGNTGNGSSGQGSSTGTPSVIRENRNTGSTRLLYWKFTLTLHYSFNWPWTPTNKGYNGLDLCVPACYSESKPFRNGLDLD